MLHLPGLHTLGSVSAASSVSCCSVGAPKRVHTLEKKQSLCLTVEAGDVEGWRELVALACPRDPARLCARCGLTGLDPCLSAGPWCFLLGLALRGDTLSRRQNVRVGRSNARSEFGEPTWGRMEALGCGQGALEGSL